MTSDQFREILRRPENETLDYKGQSYDLVTKRNDFIKDILSMANTPREDDALIVLGVRWTPEDGATVAGLQTQVDDVDFQNALGEGRVQPRPRFSYEPFDYEGKQVGVLRIPVGADGPCTPIKDYEPQLQAGAVYYRRGTGNERAIGSNLRRIIDWFLGQGGLARPDDDQSAWSRFEQATYHFSSDRYHILAVDSMAGTADAPLQAIASVPWRAVIDFDPSSDEKGLLAAIAGTLSQHRVVHRVVKGEYRVQPEPGTHWFFASGLSGRDQTQAVSDHKVWVKQYKQELGKQLERLAAAMSPRPVSVVIVWNDRELRSHLRSLIEEINGAFGDLSQIIVISKDEASFGAICDDAGIPLINMSIRSLCAGVAVHFADQQSIDEEPCILTTSAGAPIEISARDRLWFLEDLEIVYRGLGLRGVDSADEFRRGGTVSWRDLHLQYDCSRDVTTLVKTQVDADLRGRQTVRINLYHAPGAGGTTIGRRVAWDLRNTYPTAVLNRCSARDTAERIARVAALTENSVLVLVDGGEHSEREIDDLYEFLKANQTPAVLLQILRRFQTQTAGRRQFWLSSVLSDEEADRFDHAYRIAAPTKAAALSELTRSRNPQRNAFFYGLTAFGREFRGLDSYVERRLAACTVEQKRILAYVAMAHYYGQQSVPAQAFGSMLGMPRSHIVELARVFSDAAAPATDLLVEAQKREWRTAHHVIALETMQQLLSPPNSLDRASVWRQSLSSWAKEFASFCRGDDQSQSDRLAELVRRVFIYRDNTELLGTERAAQSAFSQLIEDVPSTQGKAELLRHLTEEFPEEAHFHAHLGRFLGLNGEDERALQAIDLAISLQPTDHVLHHVRGMILRYAMERCADSGDGLNRMIELAKDATASFEEARRLSPDDEHGYISEVQMLINLVDRAGRGRSDLVRNVLARPEADPFLSKALDRSEDLMDRVQHLHAGEKPSRYATECRARLQRIYGDFSRSLQAWDSLLVRPEVAKPPIRRQIVWTLLGRHAGSWDQLNRRETDRIRELLEENLQEEANDSASLRLWLRAVRMSANPPTLDSIIEKVSYWKANTGALDAAYYLYVLHALRALEGSAQGVADSEKALEECRALARFRRDRTRSFEWVGSGQGIQRLVHQSRLGEWREDFWETTAPLSRLDGRVASIDAPQKGRVEVSGGIDAFFVPAKAGIMFGRDENSPVTFLMGFSYDGPRAWDVRNKGT